MAQQQLHLQGLNQDQMSIGFDYDLVISDLADFLKGDETQFDILLFRDLNRSQQLDKALTLQQAGIQPGNVLYYNRVPLGQQFVMGNVQQPFGMGNVQQPFGMGNVQQPFGMGNVQQPFGMGDVQQFTQNGFPFNSPTNQQNPAVQPPQIFYPTLPVSQPPTQQPNYPPYPDYSPEVIQPDIPKLEANQGLYKTSVVTISESGEQVTCRDEKKYINFNLLMKNSNLNADIKVVQKDVCKLTRSDNQIASSLTVNGTVVTFYDTEQGYGIVIYWKNKNRSRVVFQKQQI